MSKGKSTVLGIISGAAVAATAIFLSKKENRDKTKAVAKKVASDVVTVAKKSRAAVKKKVTSVKKQAVTASKDVQKKAVKVKKALK
jgi:hypothetical protein